MVKREKTVSSYYQGMFLELQCCPYCKAQLVKRENYLICRYHKWAYPIINKKTVNYKMSSVIKNFDFDKK